jgi:hypothetical protein
MQKHRQQFAAASLHDLLDLFELGQVVRLGVTERGDDKGTPCPAAASMAEYLTPCTSSQNPGAPNSNSVSARSIAAWLSNSRPRDRRQQSLCDRQFAGCRRAMEEEQLHKDG